jgi:hypothetical protein
MPKIAIMNLSATRCDLKSAALRSRVGADNRRQRTEARLNVTTLLLSHNLPIKTAARAYKRITL